MRRPAAVSDQGAGLLPPQRPSAEGRSWPARLPEIPGVDVAIEPDGGEGAWTQGVPTETGDPPRVELQLGLDHRLGTPTVDPPHHGVGARGKCEDGVVGGLVGRRGESSDLPSSGAHRNWVVRRAAVSVRVSINTVALIFLEALSDRRDF